MLDETVSIPWLTEPLQNLINTAKANRLAHGLLFTGSSGLGKYRFASESAKYLLCSDKLDQGACGKCHACQLFAAKNHLDFHLLESEDKKSIGIEQVRLLIKKLTERPQLGDNKVVIIKDAQLLTTSAANALLKTLEEPQGNCYLILLARTHHQLLPTIYSRVQHTHLHSPSDESLLAWLQEQGLSVSDKGILRQFQNCPLSLLNYLLALQKGEAEDERRHCVEGLFYLLQQPHNLFDFSQFLAAEDDKRLQLFFYLLHDLHRVKLSDEMLNEDAIFAFAFPQLQIWAKQIQLKELRDITNKLLALRAQLSEHKGLKKELLINALLIEIKNRFKESITC